MKLVVKSSISRCPQSAFFKDLSWSDTEGVFTILFSMLLLLLLPLLMVAMVVTFIALCRVVCGTAIHHPVSMPPTIRWWERRSGWRKGRRRRRKEVNWWEVGKLRCCFGSQPTLRPRNCTNCGLDFITNEIVVPIRKIFLRKIYNLWMIWFWQDGPVQLQTPDDEQELISFQTRCYHKFASSQASLRTSHKNTKQTQWKKSLRVSSL